jgi:dolichol kinase
MLIREVAYAVLISGGVMVGFWLSNIAYDRGVPHYISRKVGHILGGAAYLFSALLFNSPWIPLIMVSAFTVMLAVGRRGMARAFRGVGGAGRSRGVMSEVWFPLSAVILVLLGWVWLGEPIITATCLLMMAWGDALTGIVRHQVYGRAVKGAAGSLAMFLVCILLAVAFVRPIWVGVIMAGIATVAEWLCGDVGKLKKIDDNIAIPLAAFAVYAGFYFTVL